MSERKYISSGLVSFGDHYAIGAIVNPAWPTIHGMVVVCSTQMESMTEGFEIGLLELACSFEVRELHGIKFKWCINHWLGTKKEPHQKTPESWLFHNLQPSHDSALEAFAAWSKRWKTNGSLFQRKPKPGEKLKTNYLDKLKPQQSLSGDKKRLNLAKIKSYAPMLPLTVNAMLSGKNAVEEYEFETSREIMESVSSLDYHVLGKWESQFSNMTFPEIAADVEAILGEHVKPDTLKKRLSRNYDIFSPRNTYGPHPNA